LIDMEKKSFNGLSVDFGRIHLKNPVIACSGTFAQGLEYNDIYDISCLGAITTKSFTLKERKGNIPPRIWETACGMLNSIGLQNKGIDFFIESELPRIKETNAIVILSIAGEDIEEFVKISKKIISIENDLMAVELNFSCPNVKAGGMAFCEVPEQLNKVTRAVNNVLGVPLIAKLSPNFSTSVEAAMAAKDGGAEAISLVNTMLGAAFDIESFKPRLGSVTGGLSGPAIKPVAIAKVYELAKEKILPIIGMGGIFNWKDAIEFMVAGASAVGIGTVNFVEVDSGHRIIEGIREYMKRKKFYDIGKIIGKAVD